MNPMSLRAGIAAAALCAAAMGQISIVPYSVQPYDLDSGYLDNPAPGERVLFTGTVRVPERDWLRLEFADTNLPAGSRLRLTSVADGAVQWFDGLSLLDYDNGSAYFNGNAVRVELLGAPGSRANRVRVVRVVAGSGLPDGPDSICGPTDDRQPSNDPRQGRQWPTACTAWLINATTVLTAGHCVSGSTPSQIHFNVPMSTSTGSLQLPPPEDQYAWDMRTLRSLSGSVGGDWAVVATVRNSNTGLYAGQAQGQWYELGAIPGGTSGQRIRITGYGQTSSPVPPTWNQIQKTHVGELTGINSTSLDYRTDTSGGNSGSPIIHENTGKAIGIHTHGGCTSTGGSNHGTRIDRSDLQAAIAATRNLHRAGLYQTFGSGCAGSAGTPSLHSDTFPDLGATMRIDVDQVAPSRPGALFFGASETTSKGGPLPLDLTSAGLIGCTQYVSFDLAIPVTTDATGQGHYSFAMPTQPDLAGLVFFNQYASEDPGANPAGATLTNAAKATIGD